MAASVSDVERVVEAGLLSETELVSAAGNDCDFMRAFRMGHLNSRNQRRQLSDCCRDTLRPRSKCPCMGLVRRSRRQTQTSRGLPRDVHLNLQAQRKSARGAEVDA